MHLTIFHYHLLPGGVTNVILYSVFSLLEHPGELKSITFAVGRSENTNKILNKIQESYTSTTTEVKIKVLPELDYLDQNRKKKAKLHKLIPLLKKEFGGSFWWVHNYHLGKNPLLTEALLRIAAEDPDQKIIFHIHDFPESARYNNLQLLRKHVDLPVYPSSANVRYVVINSRDQRLLIQAGIPRRLVYLANNPVFPDQLDKNHSSNIKDRMQKIYKKRFPRFDAGKPLLFYPVRTIRRKNALEACAITALAEQRVNLLVSLPGISPAEKPYSDLVEKAFHEGLVGGLWGIGAQQEKHGLSFQDLISASDLIFSSSIQEGFGYLYINSLVWGIPLFARDLDILDGIKPLFHDFSHYFYTQFLVPLSRELKTRSLKLYDAKILQLSAFLTPPILSTLKEQINTLFSTGVVDFSFLSMKDQYQVLKKIKEPAFAQETRTLNRSLLDELNNLLTKKETARIDKIQRNFGSSYYAGTMEAIIRSFNTEQIPAAGGDIQQNLIKVFAQKEYIRLLYG